MCHWGSASVLVFTRWRRSIVAASIGVVCTIIGVLAAQPLFGQTQPTAPQEPMTLTADRGFGTPAEVLENASIYLLPDPSRLPLRIARAGSQVRVIQQTGEWANVQFQDPQYGLRTGYMQSRYLRIEAASGSESAGAAVPRASTRVGIRRSESAGFFIGGGFETVAIMPKDNSLRSATEDGKGAGVVAGYGFSPRWSLYGALSAASLNAKGFEGTYTLSHFDVGTRIHFASASQRAVPFVQAALSGRTLRQDYTTGSTTHHLSASGPGLTVGGGVNVHLRPALAFSAAASWMTGSFTTYEVDRQVPAGDSFGASSARIQLGIVLFPRGSRPLD